LSKEKVKIDLWLKEIAPSDNLRKWFSHAPNKWEEFKKRYFKELAEKEALIKTLRDKDDLTLLYSSKEEKLNNAVALREYLGQ
jgi:uncharacterized protein YeaO (DUF488 family)